MDNLMKYKLEADNMLKEDSDCDCGCNSCNNEEMPVVVSKIQRFKKKKSQKEIFEIPKVKKRY